MITFFIADSREKIKKNKKNISVGATIEFSYRLPKTIMDGKRLPVSGKARIQTQLIVLQMNSQQ
jgi:hypothetical protein